MRRVSLRALRSTGDCSACLLLSRQVSFLSLRVAPIDRSPAAGSLHWAGCEDERRSVTGPATSSFVLNSSVGCSEYQKKKAH